MIRQKTPSTTTVGADLCTFFDMTRDTHTMTNRCGFPTTVVHPYKIRTQGYENWNRAFQWSTSSTRPISSAVPSKKEKKSGYDIKSRYDSNWSCALTTAYYSTTIKSIVWPVYFININFY
jgi:hypothetical protein